MKENKDRNEEFYNLHFKFKSEGKDLEQIREMVKSKMGIQNDHVYRARLSAFANPKRYSGRFIAIREFMKRQVEATVSVQTEYDIVPEPNCWVGTAQNILNESLIEQGKNN